MNFKHGHTGKPEHKAYMGAISRCTNKNETGYENYGGRGIVFNYKSFKEFIDDLGERPSKKYSLERINTGGNYEKGNCIWATRIEQNTNQRIRKDNTSNLRGVSWHKKLSKWVAQIQLNKKKTMLGYFENKFGAFESYTEAYYNHYKRFPPEYKKVEV